METKRKSSTTTHKKSQNQTQKDQLLSLNEALDLLQVTGLNRFAAKKLFKEEKSLTEKDWKSLFIKKRIVQK